jgi:uncharacterized membrane protein YoaT (DUF817 family)
VALSVALILGGLTLAVAIWAAENSQPHIGFWPYPGEIVGLVLMACGIFLAVAVVRVNIHVTVTVIGILLATLRVRAFA